MAKKIQATANQQTRKPAQAVPQKLSLLAGTLPSDRTQAIRLAIFWVLSRIVMFGIFHALMNAGITGDVTYYAQLFNHSSVPIFSSLSGILPEYPAPLVWVIQFIGLFAGNSAASFVPVYMVAVVILDGIACACLFRRESAKSAWAWAIAGLFMGPLFLGAT